MIAMIEVLPVTIDNDTVADQIITIEIVIIKITEEIIAQTAVQDTGAISDEVDGRYYN